MATAPDQRVVTVSTVKGVIATAAFQPVGRGISSQDIAVDGADKILDAAQAVSLRMVPASGAGGKIDDDPSPSE